MGYKLIELNHGDSVKPHIKSRSQGDKIKFVLYDHNRSVNRVAYVLCDEKCGLGFAYHRLDGPAKIIDGILMFYVGDVLFGNTESYCRVAGMSDEETLMWVLRFGNKLPRTVVEYYGFELESIPIDQL